MYNTGRVNKKKVNVSNGRLLYHTTNINNIPSIIKYGIVCRRMLESNNAAFDDCADPSILDKRKELNFELDMYVPFHFFPRTPFEKRICLNGIENLAIVTIYRPINIEKIKSYKIIPTHPLCNEKPSLLSYFDGMNNIEWDILDDYDSDHSYDYTISHNRNATMAECLVPNIVQPEDIAYIFVCSDEIKNAILDEIGSNPFADKICVNRNMFPYNGFRNRSFTNNYY